MILLKPCFFTLEIILFKSALNKHDGTKQVSYFVIKTNQKGFISSFLSNDEIGRLCIRLVHSPKYKNNYIEVKGTSLL